MKPAALKPAIMMFALVLGTNLSCISLLSGYFSNDDAGRAGAQFLKQGEGARAIAMGKAGCAVADDLTAIYWNPAGLARMRGSQLLGVHAFALENMNYDFLGFGHSWPGFSLAAGFNLLSMPPLEKLNEFGENEGWFAPYAFAFNLAAAVPFQNWLAGVNGKCLREDFGTAAATAYAADLGIRYRLADQNLDLGLVLQNIGTPLQWKTQADPLPFTIRCGLAYQALPGLKLALDMEAPLDNIPSLHAGGEYFLSLAPGVSVCARAGLQTVSRSGLHPLLGGGLRFSGLMLDYAWIPLGDVGSAHRIALGISFAEPAPPESPGPVSDPLPVPASSAPAGNTLPVITSIPECVSPAQPAPAAAAKSGRRPRPGEISTARSKITYAGESESSSPAAGIPTALTESSEDAAQDYKTWVEIYYAKSLEYFKLGKYYTAYTYCGQALKWDPDHQLLLELRGHIEAEMKSPEARP